MFTSKVGSAGAGSTTGAQSTQKSRIGKPKSLSAAGKVAGASDRNIQANFYLQRLHERPRLISELSDTHKSFCSATVVMERLKRVVASLIKIRKILQRGEFSPELVNQIDIEKKSVVSAVETRLFGEYIMDSSFAPVTGAGSWIEFKIPGLDFVRERLTDELVTIYLNRNMLPLAFDRTVSDHLLLEQFRQQAGYSHLRVRVDEDKSLVVAIRDIKWRLWDGVVYISGQGGRYASGQPISFQVNAVTPTVEDVTRLDLRETVDPQVLDPVIEHVNRIHKNLYRTLTGQKESAQQLLDLCQNYDESKTDRTRQLLTELPGRAAMTIYRNYSGPSRENVINLLEE